MFLHIPHLQFIELNNTRNDNTGSTYSKCSSSILVFIKINKNTYIYNAYINNYIQHIIQYFFCKRKTYFAFNKGFVYHFKL